MSLPPFHHPLTVRYADTDAQGHVFFANYLTYADEGLTHWMLELGFPPGALVALGVDMVFVESACTYRGRSFFQDRLRVHCAPVHLGHSSLAHRFEIVREGDGAPIAGGRLTQVCIDLETRRAAPLPEPFRARILEAGLWVPPPAEGAGA